MQLPNDLKSTKSLHHIVIVEDWNNILSKQWHSLVYSIGWIDAFFFFGLVESSQKILGKWVTYHSKNESEFFI